MTNRSVKLSRPGIGSLHDPSDLVSLQLRIILVLPSCSVFPMRRNQSHPPVPKCFPQNIEVGRALGYHSVPFLPGTPLGPHDSGFDKRGFRKDDFMRSGAFHSDSHQNTFTVNRYHPHKLDWVLMTNRAYLLDVWAEATTSPPTSVVHCSQFMLLFYDRS